VQDAKTKSPIISPCFIFSLLFATDSSRDAARFWRKPGAASIPLIVGIPGLSVWLP
jgi:hypothetical protein